MNTVVDQKLSSLSFSEIFSFACVIFVSEKKSKLKKTLFWWYRIAMIVPKNSLNTSNATLRTQNDRKCYSQWWHVLFQRSWLDKVCIFFKYLSAESCDSLLSWPCVNLGRLSHQTTINKNNFCLLDITVDTLFRDSILPLVYSMRSPYDCIQTLMKTYELKVTFIYFLPKKIIKNI